MKTQFCGYDVHPAANLFPMMTDDEFDELLDDIREHGQILPIILHDDKILDGRNRAMACHRLGKTPKVEILTCDDPISWAMSANYHRRNLSLSQKSAVAADSVELYKAEAKERQRVLSASRSGAGQKEVPAKLQEAAGEAVEKAAKAMGISPRSVYDAKKIKEESPEVFEQLKSGEVTLQQAKKDLYGGSKAHEGSIVVKPRDEAPEDKQSDVIWSLNYHWKRATKREQAEWCNQHGLIKNSKGTK